ncbi:MAG TPA: NAD(P)-binding protein [Candidatus Binataceae bacterium]|nr:NAD(P)-binding protein [Candidatus Binataceae bacterium]
MTIHQPIEVAVIGGGCASIAAAFELSRPEHRGAYHVTVYQLGWRLGGKGASGRGPADRIEEHGLHIWMGFYENAFQLLRECYAELKRDPRTSRFADWRDAFTPEPMVGVMERNSTGTWSPWQASFPPAQGQPGDPLERGNPFSVTAYMMRMATMIRITLGSIQLREPDRPAAAGESYTGGTAETGGESRTSDRSRRGAAGAPPPGATDQLAAAIARLIKYGVLATIAALAEAAAMLELAVRAVPLYPASLVLGLIEALAAGVCRQIEPLIANDDELRRLWEIIDVNLAVMTGIVRFGLATDPRGFDAIDDYELRDWLRLNGASDRALDSALIRGIYDLAFAYEDGDATRPCQAAGLAIRGSLRMFFTYRGAFFWRMQAAMGDVVFAPFYEVLKRRGVTFKFFHRLANLRLADSAALAPGERPHVAALEFDVQADLKDGAEYDPLVDVRGLPCWPSRPDFSQLAGGAAMAREGRDFESHWDRRKAATRTLKVGRDFDVVVLGVGLGAIPHVCRELIDRDDRWRDLVRHVKTVATQAFQIWLAEDMAALGWPGAQTCLSGFVHPFDTWADMRHLIPEESWPLRPRAIAYFCSALPDAEGPAPDPHDADYPVRRRAAVRDSAIRFLDRDIGHLWPRAIRPGGGFRWDLLVDPRASATTATSARAAPPGADAARFATQFWSANVNPSDRYVQSRPGSTRFRISPLDNTYDNLTVAGDWTACGLNVGCVEAAIISGRLAAHAISSRPALSDIIGYDHP